MGRLRSLTDRSAKLSFTDSVFSDFKGFVDFVIINKMPGVKRKRGVSYSTNAVVLAAARPSYKRRKRSSGSRGSYAASYGGKGGETKYVDGYLSANGAKVMSITGNGDWTGTEENPRQVTGNYGCLPIPRQGNNYADRNGRKIFMKNIRINGTIDWPAVSASAAAMNLGSIRIIVVKDTRTNGTTLSGENVIGPGLGSDGLATVSGDNGGLNLPTNPDGWGRYKIMYDKTFRPPAKGMAGVTGALHFPRVMEDFTIKIKANCQVNFNASTGEVGSVVDNSFHLLAACNDQTTDCQLNYYARTSFTG